MKGEVVVLLGAQWGDEGKGKMVDYLLDLGKIRLTARCQGGNNAGHTVVANGRKYDFHILPSGIINPECLNVIGNGVVVNLDALRAELEKNGLFAEPEWEKRICISAEAHIVFGVHSLVDSCREQSLSQANKIGTTNRGIGPAYSTKCFRNGIRLGELVADFDDFANRYRQLVEYFKNLYPAIADHLNVDEELKKFADHREFLLKKKLVKDTVELVHSYINDGKDILIEGANGALLDIDFGTYPYVTSSNSTVGGACTGLGVPPTSINHVIGVVKAYQSRVGAGPFPTECKDDVGDKLQSIGKEIGVSTGRKRRCGWIDLFLLRRSVMLNGFTALALTKVDVLDSFDEIKIGVGYMLNGERLDSPPSRAIDWDRIEVIYHTMKGWQKETRGVRRFEDLPSACKDYINYLENFVKVPVKWIGVGAERDALIVKPI